MLRSDSTASAGGTDARAGLPSVGRRWQRIWRSGAALLLNTLRANTVRFIPSLTITMAEVDDAAERLKEALKQF
jgi:4-aminobutyrate aminotransferase-like enzyme